MSEERQLKRIVDDNRMSTQKNVDVSGTPASEEH